LHFIASGGKSYAEETACREVRDQSQSADISSLLPSTTGRIAFYSGGKSDIGGTAGAIEFADAALGSDVLTGSRRKSVRFGIIRE